VSVRSWLSLVNHSLVQNVRNFPYLISAIARRAAAEGARLAGRTGQGATAGIYARWSEERAAWHRACGGRGNKKRDTSGGAILGVQEVELGSLKGIKMYQCTA